MEHYEIVLMSHKNDDKRRKFLNDVHIGDYVILQLRSASPYRNSYSAEGNVVGVNYYTVRLSDRLPEEVVADQERGFNLGRLLEYSVKKREK